MKISVAIPIYNAARHLNVTLDSLVNQTMDKKDFEVICVDDVSTDNSISVVESYMKKHECIKLINRTTNSGGPMLPRNDAINAAKGKYILFLDNDDFLGEETLERFYKSAEKNNSDVIFGRYVGVNGRGVPQSMFKYGNLANAEITKHNLVFSLAPHKMFNLNFVRENNIHFHKEAVVGEDQLFVMQCYINADVITVLADYDYYYVVKRGEENLSLKYFPAENFFYSFNHILRSIKESTLNEFYKKMLSVSFLNRFFHASRLRKYILTDLLTRKQKNEWLYETKKFIDKHVTDELINLLPSRFHYFILIAREGNLNKLLMVDKQMKSVSPNQVVDVKDGWIKANFSYISKKVAYDSIYPVNHKNTSNIFVDKILIDRKKKQCQISGLFYQSMLINENLKYELVLVHRKTKVEKRVMCEMPHNNIHFTSCFNFIDLTFDSKLAGPWDVYLEGTVGGYKKRRRVGKDRSTDIEEIDNVGDWDDKRIPSLNNTVEKKEIMSLKELRLTSNTFGVKYNIKVYFTKHHDNLSFDVVIQN